MLYLQGIKLYDWQVSEKAGQSPESAIEALRTWFNRYKPEIVISQNPDVPGRKGADTIAVLAAIARAIEDADVHGILVTRAQRFNNLYEEATALAKRYPALQGKCPRKPKCWEDEPRGVIYFEALALALQGLGE
ncbi:hypothetical protein [Leisingera sp. ANG59]|uniref:hypothetical protein n=1 Tax=Leisingera sp. ANG59 TaxID=2675221 RepID=UPI0015736AC1|nr:hypothetical protein [Leisingera sp. ANG59]NSY37537.1 hypothetical protein [Leisingera sp. ANG59]